MAMEGAGRVGRVVAAAVLLASCVLSIDPVSKGGTNIEWTMSPSAEHISQLLGWRDLQGLRTIKADDSHYGDRFGRTVVLHGDHLIVGADYSTCQDAAYSPGGSCSSPGKGAVYIFERDYVTSPYYRWSDTVDTGSWGGYPSADASSTTCDPLGENCVTTVGFCTDSSNASTDGLACNAANACAYAGTCKYAPPFSVAGSKYWGQRIKLQPSDLSTGDRFGSAIAYDGDTNTLVVGAPKQTVAGRCGLNFLDGIREGAADDCAEAGAVYVFQKDYGGMNNWGQVAKMTTDPGTQISGAAYCASGGPSPVAGNGNCPGSSCQICTSEADGVSRDNDTHVHVTHPKQHFGAAVSISQSYIAVGCPRCNGVNKCGGRCYDGTSCGRCNVTTTTPCLADAECDTSKEYCQVNRCQDGSFCSLWSLERGAGKAFVYKNLGSDAWSYVNEVVPQPTGGFEELSWWQNGGRYCGNRAQGVCGTDGTVVCTTDADCDLSGGICEGGSNGGNACTADSQCPGSGVCSSTCGGLNIDPLHWTCCRDGQNFGGSVAVYYDPGEEDYILAVGAMNDKTSVTYGESYDRRNHGSVYLFQSNLCCMSGASYELNGTYCGYPTSTTDCSDVWGQVKGMLASGRAHQFPVNTGRTCGKINYNGNSVPWVSPNTENLLMHYCWHTEKIAAVDEDQDTFFGRQVYLGSCDIYLGKNSTCLLVTRGKLYADEIYVYARNKPGYVLEEGATESGKGTGYASTQFGYGDDFKNQWALHRKHCDANYQCPPTDNSGTVQASTTATGCTCNGGYRDGFFCYADEDCQGGNQDSGFTWAGNCHDGQDELGASCTASCQCTSGLLCSWHAGSLGGDETDVVQDLRWTYETTTSAAVPKDCPGGITDSGVVAGVENQKVFKLASTAAPFDAIYVGFTISVSSTVAPWGSDAATWQEEFQNATNETRVIVGYTADRVVTVSEDFGTPITTSSKYFVHTSTGWAGYPTQMTNCPQFQTFSVASVTNIVDGSHLLIDDEIFLVMASVGTELTTLRARSGTVAASHASGAVVNIITGTGTANFGNTGADSLLAAMQASTSLYTGGVIKRCATITLDAFRADSTDNIYRNWYVSITSGTGVAQSARIMHYDGELKLAVIDCVSHGQYWTGYAQAGYTSGYTGQGYGAYSSSGNVPTPCRRSWIRPPAYSYRYYRFRVLKARSGWTDTVYSSGFTCTGCCLATGWSIQEIQLFEQSTALTPVLSQITPASATAPAVSGVGVNTSSASLAIDGCPASRGTAGACSTTGYYTGGETCDSVANACGDYTDAFYQYSYNGQTCAAFEMAPLILDLGATGAKRVDKYRFATTMMDGALNHEPTRWVLEGTDDGTAAGGDAYDPYGFCGAGLNINTTGACLCSATGTPYCAGDPTAHTVACFCRSRWNVLHDMSKVDYTYSSAGLVRGAFIPDSDDSFWAGYFTVPKSTYQLCQTYVDSNGVCNEGPCSEVACSGATGDVDPLASDYLKQAKAFASQYQANTNIKGKNKFNRGAGTTSGGAFGGDVTGKPFWGNPISADRASSSSGRSEDDLMAIGDYSYSDNGAVFMVRRNPYGDYLTYVERYDYFPMPLPSWVD